ncbi:hypothetical protein F5887DRAFT_219673 [Amanita rubescens]|nr:hypothetical protein F5887DRAFT_658167 [Amanita rubescens]KAF8345229.1 hypothetical protein F5887DRAFT_219673 [Amanita rubescens]
MVKSFVAVSAAFIQLGLLARVSTGLPMPSATGAQESQVLSKRNKEHQRFKRTVHLIPSEIAACAIIGGIVVGAAVSAAYENDSRYRRPSTPDLERGGVQPPHGSDGRPSTSSPTHECNRLPSLPPAPPAALPPAPHLARGSGPSTYHGHQNNGMTASHAAHALGSSTRGPPTDHDQNNRPSLYSPPSYGSGGSLGPPPSYQ